MFSCGEKTMPTVLRVNGYEVIIYTHDHLPRHVHIFKAEMEVQIYIETLAVKEANRAATKKFIKEARDIVATFRDFLDNEWNRISPVA
jgi:hypothetical protein